MKLIPFIGRQNELLALQRIAKRRTASLVVITGRRRIGKSRLVEEFAKGRSFYAFSGLPPEKTMTARQQREEFIRQMMVYWDIPPIKSDNWGDLFLLLSKQIKQQKTVVLLDEISWMSSQDGTFLGQLKIAWDLYFKKNTQLMLFFCGSVSTWIEENILGSTGFFGRVTHQITLSELSLQESYLLLEKQGFQGSISEKFMLLSVTGGIPWYLELIDSGLSAENNIKALCFLPEGILVNEFRRIFHDLFQTRSDSCQKIIECLAEKTMTYKEISMAIQYASGGPLSGYLNELVISGYVTKDVNWSLTSGRDVRIERYRLRDNYLRFYLRYIHPNLTKIKKGHFHEIALSSLPGWHSIIGLQFENIVLNNRKLIWKVLGIDPSEIINDNPYLQKQTKLQQGCQIDYLIQTKYNTLYACEIKFSKNPVDASVIEAMKEKFARLKRTKILTCIPVLIHVNGVSSDIEDSQYFFKQICLGDLIY